MPEQQKPKHSELPWKVQAEYGKILDACGYIVPVCGVSLPTGAVSENDDGFGNQALIVPAVNCHDTLLEALRSALPVITSLDCYDMYLPVRKLMAAAIAKAEGRDA